jgi:hypothetical protein
MMKPAIGFLAVCLMIPALASAQIDGGGDGTGQGQQGQGHGHGGRHGGGQAGQAPGGKPSGPPIAPQVPVDQVQIVGVVTALDPASGRITLQYEANDALNLPAGTTPFEVSKTALMNGVTVGEKVRFRLDSHQIADIRPF